MVHERFRCPIYQQSNLGVRPVLRRREPPGPHELSWTFVQTSDYGPRFRGTSPLQGNQRMEATHG